MGLLLLSAGLMLFIGGHLVTTRRDFRAELIGRFGEGPYKILYGVVALLGIVLIAYGFGRYRATGWIDVWQPPPLLRLLGSALMWPSVVLVVAAYLRGRIYATLKHPMLAGVKLWAFAHLLANGDLGSILLFGAILAWAVYDRISLKGRSDAGGPPIPVGGIGNDILAIAVGTVAYLALALVFHPVVIGVPVVGS
ncbi:MAG: NnrU family protein [Xanthobacteraceae bacterium]|nr:MAG: NnrU family protein [Xanthobacteraceae bacterium]